MPYESTAAAMAAADRLTEPESRWAESKYVRLLNGEWSFCWAERPAELPDRLEDAANWGAISVPGVWQLDGYDRPIYRNHALTWERIPEVESEPEPPNVPEEFNPVGTYRRTVDVPTTWGEDRRTFLHFEGVKSAFFVWIDGEYVGYDQGSMTPSEFDVTDALDVGGTHTLTVQVFRFSDGSYLETQDMLRFSGIFRSVYLYSKPPVHLRDYVVQTTFDDAYEDATLTVEADLGGAVESTDPWTIAGRLFDEGGTEVTTLEATAVPADDAEVTLRTTVTSPAAWSAERPTLYDLVLELRGADGRVVEAVPERVGFREFEIEDGRVLVNGEPMTVRGINRHEHDPETGRTVPFDRVLTELRMLKRHNVNAIRTAHYPNDLPVYELADELGLYVVDEANVETHFNMNFVNEAPAFHRSFVRRFEGMVEHHKNFASIFAWSTSNEAGEGAPHREMAAYARERDGTRFVYHQGSGAAPYDEYHENMTGTAPFADISGPRYPVPHTLVQHSAVEDRPLIMGEYAHALGNSLGLQDAFWELVREIDGLQGGFVWEWTNQTLAGEVVPDGNADEWWFDDDPFLLDGVVFSDLSPQPELRQLKKTQQPFAFEAVAIREGVLAVTNHHAVTNLSAFETTWELTVDGNPVQSGRLRLDVPPSRTRGVIVPFDRSTLPPGTECHLTLRVRLPEETDWAAAGHEIGFEQFAVPIELPEPSSIPTADGGHVTIKESETAVTVAGDRFRYRFDLERGCFREFRYGDAVVARDGPLFGAFRATVPNEGVVDSDTEWGYDNESEWLSLGLHDLEQTVVEHAVGRTADGTAHLSVATIARNPDGIGLFEVDYDYDVDGTGTVVVTIDVAPTSALRDSLSSWLPRLGVQFDVPPSATDFEWFGRGPEETYPDRKTGSAIGRYAGSVDDQFVPYRLPSDNGNKTDVRWASLTGPTAGFAVVGDRPLNVRLDRYENLAEAASLSDLVAADGTRLFVDVAVSGVGGTPVKPLPEHRVMPEPASFGLTIRPYYRDETESAVLAREIQLRNDIPRSRE
ncbi:glycoside hydrolase family 2 TIM barrel-domain containing protein [Halosolutus gelatinilyticus]|uniref:glycoside hydrolase family 2 TIM barrel-domain containing protein n=1 Tax=Halosolutus gelatinilyticus TaxID=2931975 RepID=UPI001FF33A1D|nr:glycoside hydrolase family 2 TIM barrel-domain containing protein [Halosolutus gelatinilyticus]